MISMIIYIYVIYVYIYILYVIYIYVHMKYIRFNLHNVFIYDIYDVYIYNMSLPFFSSFTAPDVFPERQAAPALVQVKSLELPEHASRGLRCGWSPLWLVYGIYNC